MTSHEAVIPPLTTRAEDSDMDLKNAGLVFCDPAAYADEPSFYEACASLRQEEPVHLVEAKGFNPFWAITKHDDLLEIERDTDGWLAAPRPALGPESQDAARGEIPDTDPRPDGSSRSHQLPAGGVGAGSARAASVTSSRRSASWHGAGSTGWPTSAASAISSLTSPCTSRCM